MPKFTEYDIQEALTEITEFQRLFKWVSDLEYAAYWFPNYADKLIEKALEPAEFKRFFKESDLEYAAYWFPKYAYLFKSDMDSTLKAIKEYGRKKIQITTAARIIGQGRRTQDQDRPDQNKPCLFKDMPENVVALIAAYTGGFFTTKEGKSNPEEQLALQKLGKLLITHPATKS